MSYASYGAVAPNAGMERRAPLIEKQVLVGGRSYTVRLLEPFGMMPWWHVCSGDWDVAAKEGAAPGGVAMRLAQQQNKDRFKPGTFPNWYKAEMAKGLAIVIDLQPSYKSWCALFSKPGDLPMPTSARAYSTNDVSFVQKLLLANSHAFLLNSENVKWVASGSPMPIGTLVTDGVVVNGRGIAGQMGGSGSLLALGVVVLGVAGVAWYLSRGGETYRGNSAYKTGTKVTINWLAHNLWGEAAEPRQRVEVFETAEQAREFERGFRSIPGGVIKSVHYEPASSSDFGLGLW